MKLAHKINIGFLTIAFLSMVTGYVAIVINKKLLEETFMKNTESLAVNLQGRIMDNLGHRMEAFQECSYDTFVQEMILKSNRNFEEMNNMRAYIEQKDKEWTSVPRNHITPFMHGLINNRLSDELRRKVMFYEKKYGYKVFGEVFIANKYGANIAQTGKTTDFMQDDEVWWQTAKDKGMYIGDVAYDESADMYSIDIGLRIDDENGDFIGVMKVVHNINELIKLVDTVERENLVGLHKGHRTMEYKIITKEGRLIYSSNKDLKFLDDVSHLLPPEHLSPEYGHPGFSYHKKFSTIGGERVEAYIAHAHISGDKDLKDLGWILIVEHSVKELFAPIAALKKRVLFASAIVTLTGVIMGLMISFPIRKKINRLQDFTKRVGKGDFDAGLDYTSGDELGQLAKSFQQMTEDLKTTTVRRDELIREIFERKQTEETLKQEKFFSDTLINSLPGVFYLFDDKGRFLKWNKNLETMTGYSDEEISEMSHLDFFKGEDKKLVEEKIREVFAEGESSVEADFVSKKGERIPYFFTGISITLGNKLCLLGVGIDISVRRKAEEALSLIKQDWEDTFNTITDMITVHDKDYNIIRANKAAEEILKLPDLQVNRIIKCFSYYHGTDCPPKGCPSCDCLKTGKSAAFELFEPHLNMFIEIRAIARFDKDNQIAGLIHVVRDITDRRKIEETVKKGKLEWEMTFDNASEFIALVDRDGKIIRCNKSFADFVKVPIKEAAGLMCTDLIPVNPEQFKPGMPATKVEVMTTNHEWLYISCCPVLDENSQYLRTVIIGTDITALKYTEERMIKSEEELKNRVDELERFYEMAVGRELRMKDLKNEIKKLQKELSQYKNIQT